MVREWKLKYIPRVYHPETGSRPLSDDWKFKWIPEWLQPWTKIPRWWRFFPMPFPPRKWAGTQEEADIEIQEGYPLAPDTVKIWEPGIGDTKKIKSIHPVGWGWSIQSCYFPILGRVPCYFQWTAKTWFGRRIHVNFGLRPDVTDWAWWWPEFSLSVVKITI